MPTKKPRKFKMVCAECGSENVLRDAWAYWDKTTQRWELNHVFDHAVCESEECGGEETNILEMPIQDTTA